MTAERTSVTAAVRIDYVEFSYIHGGLGFLIDGDPLIRYAIDTGNEYLE